MDMTTRRMFCGTALLAFPMLQMFTACKQGIADDLVGAPDPLLDTLADEFTRISADGAQNGFRAEHFRRYAELTRIFDAHLESQGTNQEIDRRLDKDDVQKLNPAQAAHNAVNYWRRHGIDFREDELADRLTMDSRAYREAKKEIKKMGGAHVLHTRIADALERKAKEYETAVLRGGAAVRDGRVSFPGKGMGTQPRFMNVQFYESMSSYYLNLNCLCRAMVVEGAILALLCAIGFCPAFCAPAALLLALEKLLEGLGLCNPGGC
jgi:hypothetical protein